MHTSIDLRVLSLLPKTHIVAWCFANLKEMYDIYITELFLEVQYTFIIHFLHLNFLLSVPINYILKVNQLVCLKF